MAAAFRILTALLALAALASCADYPEYQPVVDMAGHAKAAYDYDLLLCRENARELDVLKGAVIGALAGAALGAGIGAATGSAAGGAVLGTTAGIVGGGGAGSLHGSAATAQTGRDPHEGDIRRCLKARGYRLLDEEPPARSG